MWNPVGATAPKRLGNIYFCVYLPGTSYQELHLIWQQEGRSKALKCTTEFKYELTGMEAHTREQQPESQPEKAKVYMRRYPNMSLRRPDTRLKEANVKLNADAYQLVCVTLSVPKCSLIIDKESRCLWLKRPV